MAEQELDALVVRAPDNVLYLTNFWGMKGYDACVFPREGEPVLLCLEASAEDAARTAWTDEVRYVRGYDETRPAPAARAHARRGGGGVARLRPRRPRALARHAGLRPDGRRADDVHAGLVRRVAGRGRRDAAARRRARDQDRPGARADPARERDLRRGDGARARRAAAGDEGERGGRALAGVRPRRGHGLGAARVELALGFSLVWSGAGIKTFTATGDRPVQRGRADAVRDLGLRRRLLVRPHEAPLPGRAARRLPRARGRAARGVRPRDRPLPAGREPRRARPADPRRPRRGGLSRASRRTRSATASARARTSRRTRTRPAAARSRSGWCSRSSRAATGRAAAACASRTTSSITADGAEKLSSFPDGVVAA